MEDLPGLVERWRDPALAAVLTVLAVLDVLLQPPPGPALLLVLTVGVTAPLAVRRRFPLAVPVIVIACFAATAGADPTERTRVAAVAALVVAMWTMGRHCEDRRLAIGVGWFALGLLAATALSPTGGDVEDALFGLVLFLIPLVAGRAVRLRQAHVDLVTERAGRAEQDRAQELAAAADAERDRIARELHDIVMHSISVIAVQTQAIRRRLGPEHAREVDDLAAVERSAREAMTEMRRLFGVLRAGDGPPELAPQPGLAQLDRLLEDARRSGLRIEARVALPEQPLTAGVDLTAYRVVQEALTNVLKHAGPGTSVHVVVEPGPGELALEICDDGRSRAAGAPGGHGLVGMRERVAVYGGSLEVGRRPGGGFRVAARLPLGATVAS